MPVSLPRKDVCPSQLPCGGIASVTLSFTAEPEVCATPTDLVLVLDRSRSMAGTPMLAMKESVRQLLRQLAAVQSAEGSCPLRVGLVSFAGKAAVDASLTAEFSHLTQLTDRYTACGCTGQADAIDKAAGLLTDAGRRRILLLFTDGSPNTGEAPTLAARRACDDGIEIFCVGLGVSSGLLSQWATSEDHVLVTDCPRHLPALFLEAGSALIGAGARDIVLDECVSKNFELLDVQRISHGTVKQLSSTCLRWSISALGTAGTETASLTFRIRHTGSVSGRLAVNDSLCFRDAAGDTLVFPNPTVIADCRPIEPCLPEPCPMPLPFDVHPCCPCTHVNLPPVCMTGLGRIVQIHVTLHDICPGKRVAVAVLLSEIEKDGSECSRGMKTFTVPAHHGPICQDVHLDCIRFVLPEDSCCASLCSSRHFQARVLANYLDSDMVCCDTVIPPNVDCAP